MIVHVQNRAPRFNGARYLWDGYDKTKYENTVDAERVDFRNCLMYNWGNGNGCYGGPGGGYINIVNNYYKAGPGTTNKTRVTQVSVSSSGNSEDKTPVGLSSRYYISGNYVTAATDSPENYDWKGVKYDSGLVKINDEQYMKDNDHHFGSKVEYVKDDKGNDCVSVKLTQPIEAGTVTTHTAQNAYENILSYCGASLYRDAVDARYMEEARTGTVTYHGDVPGPKGSSSKTEGILDFINDPNGTEEPKTASFPTLWSQTRSADFDTDGDGMPDEWERLNGLDPNNAEDGSTYSLDPKGFYTNVEVYINQLVEDIMKNGNANAESTVDEYYPTSAKSGVTEIEGNQSEVVAVEYYNLSGMHRAKESRFAVSSSPTVLPKPIK